MVEMAAGMEGREGGREGGTDGGREGEQGKGGGWQILKSVSGEYKFLNGRLASGGDFQYRNLREGFRNQNPRGG